MDGLSEASGVQETAGDVVAQVGEAEGDAPERLESAVDGLGGPVRVVVPVEEGEDVPHAFLHGAPQDGEFGAAFAGAVREAQRPVRRVRQDLVGLFPLPVGARRFGLQQYPPAPVKRVGPGARRPAVSRRSRHLTLVSFCPASWTTWNGSRTSAARGA